MAEAAVAKPVPDIAAGTLHGLRAKVSGSVVNTNLVSGTMLVVPGQAVEAGQGLIGTARAERDGTLIFQPAAGIVRAQFEWEEEQEEALTQTTEKFKGTQPAPRPLPRPARRAAEESGHTVEIIQGTVGYAKNHPSAPSPSGMTGTIYRKKKNTVEFTPGQKIQKAPTPLPVPQLSG